MHRDRHRRKCFSESAPMRIAPMVGNLVGRPSDHGTARISAASVAWTCTMPQQVCIRKRGAALLLCRCVARKRKTFCGEGATIKWAVASRHWSLLPWWSLAFSLPSPSSRTPTSQNVAPKGSPRCQISRSLKSSFGNTKSFAASALQRKTQRKLPAILASKRVSGDGPRAATKAPCAWRKKVLNGCQNIGTMLWWNEPTEQNKWPLARSERGCCCIRRWPPEALGVLSSFLDTIDGVGSDEMVIHHYQRSSLW